MNRYVVDFETYYDKKNGPSVSSQGNRNYIRDSYAYCVSIVGPDVKWVGTVADAQAVFRDAFWEDPNNEFWAANSNFDESWHRSIWTGAAKMKPWKCLLDLGAVHQLSDNLASIAQTVLKVKLDKGIRTGMSGRHFRDLSADEQKATLNYCLKDGEIAYEILNKLPQPSTIEQKIAAHTRMTNMRGVRIDVDRMLKDKEMLQQYEHDAFKRIPWHADAKPGSPIALAKWGAAEGVTIPKSRAKTDLECIELMGADPKLRAVIMAFRQYDKARKLRDKVDCFLARLSPENILQTEFRYCGARHTRRLTNPGEVSLLNLDRDPYWLTDNNQKPREGEGYNVWPRRWIIPRPGKVFYCVDEAQIEPRFLNWLVGNTALLDTIRTTGYSIYEAYARMKGLWTSDQSLKKGNPTLYGGVKARCIGLGYGMGDEKFQAENAKYGNVITLEQAHDDKMEWRRDNPKIIKQWEKFDTLIRDTVREKDKTLSITLPTGDTLRHFNVRAFTRKYLDEETGKWETKSGYESHTTQGGMDGWKEGYRASIWGGTLTENVCQRVSRDALMESTVKAEESGLPCLFHVYDEGIFEVDEVGCEEAGKEIDQILCTPPAWADSIPLAVEGVFSKTYVK